MTMVGDAYAAPLVEELRRVPTICRRCTRSAPGERQPIRNINRRCWRPLPQITIINGYGSSETGNMGFGHSQRGAHKDTFELRPGGWCSPRTTPDSSNPARTKWVGWRGPAESHWATSTIAEATRKTFPDVDGQRVVVSGDRGCAGGRWHPAAVRPRLAGGQHRGREGLRRGGRGSAAGTPGGRRRVGGRAGERAMGPGDRRPGRAARGWNADARVTARARAHRSWRGSRRRRSSSSSTGPPAGQRQGRLPVGEEHATSASRQEPIMT